MKGDTWRKPSLARSGKENDVLIGKTHARSPRSPVVHVPPFYWYQVQPHNSATILHFASRRLMRWLETRVSGFKDTPGLGPGIYSVVFLLSPLWRLLHVWLLLDSQAVSCRILGPLDIWNKSYFVLGLHPNPEAITWASPGECQGWEEGGVCCLPASYS